MMTKTIISRSLWGTPLINKFKYDLEFLTMCILERMIGSIQLAMEDQNVNRKDLAKKIGRNISYINKILDTNNMNTKVKDLCVLAHALNMFFETELVDIDGAFVYDPNLSSE